MGLLKSKLMLRLTLAVSVFGVAVGAVSTMAWFQINNSVAPAQTAGTKGLQTNATVYQENNHANDDAYQTTPINDMAGTLSYDHAQGGTATNFYIREYNSSAVETQTTQMYTNATNNDDLAVIYNYSFTNASSYCFKVYNAETNTFLGINSLSDASIDDFEARTAGGNNEYISLGVTGKYYDIYVNEWSEIYIKVHGEVTTSDEMGNESGWYICGNDSTDSNSSMNNMDGTVKTGIPMYVNAALASEGSEDIAYYAGLRVSPGDTFWIMSGDDLETHYYVNEEGSSGLFTYADGVITAGANALGYYTVALNHSHKIYLNPWDGMEVNGSTRYTVNGMADQSNQRQGVERKARRNAASNIPQSGFSDFSIEIQNTGGLNTGDAAKWYAEFKKNSSSSSVWKEILPWASYEGTKVWTTSDDADIFSYDYLIIHRQSESGTTWNYWTISSGLKSYNYIKIYNWPGDAHTSGISKQTKSVLTIQYVNQNGTVIKTPAGTITCWNTDNISSSSGWNDKKSPTISNYSFSNWYTSATGNTLATIDAYISKNATIYARYNGNQYNITYKDQGNVAYSGSNSGSLPAKHTYGTATTLVPGVKTGYNFDAWYTNSGCTEQTGITVVGGNQTVGATAKTAAFTLYAKWTAKTYTVTLDQQGGDGGASSVSGVTFNADMPEIAVGDLPTKDNYDFVGYYSGTGGTGTKYYNADGTSAHEWNIDGTGPLYAHWAVTYTVSFTKNNTSPYSSSYGNLSGTSISRIPNNSKVTAVTSTSSGGSITINGNTITATPITMTTQYQYTFIGWEWSDTHNAVAVNDTITADRTIIATFARATRSYTITWNDYNGTQLKQETLEFGTTPSYGSTPSRAEDNGHTYTFAGWSPAITTVSGNQTYTATYNAIPKTFTVTLNTNGGTINAGDVTGYTYGIGATLPTNVTKGGGYTFAGWYDNSSFTGSRVYSISTTAYNDKTYYAKWDRAEGYYVIGTGVNGSTGDFDISEAVYTGGSDEDNVAKFEGVTLTSTAKWKIVYYHPDTGNMDWQNNGFSSGTTHYGNSWAEAYASNNILCNSAGTYKIYLGNDYKISVNIDVTVTYYEKKDGIVSSSKTTTGNTDIYLADTLNGKFGEYAGYRIKGYYSNSACTSSMAIANLRPTPSSNKTVYALYEELPAGYLAGSFNGWDTDDSDYKLTVDPSSDTRIINTSITLYKGSEFKLVYDGQYYGFDNLNGSSSAISNSHMIRNGGTGDCNIYVAISGIYSFSVVVGSLGSSGAISINDVTIASYRWTTKKVVDGVVTTIDTSSDVYLPGEPFTVPTLPGRIYGQQDSRGWYLSSSGTGNADYAPGASSSFPSGNLTIYAIYDSAPTKTYYFDVYNNNASGLRSGTVTVNAWWYNNGVDCGNSQINFTVADSDFTGDNYWYKVTVPYAADLRMQVYRSDQGHGNWQSSNNYLTVTEIGSTDGAIFVVSSWTESDSSSLSGSTNGTWINRSSNGTVQSVTLYKSVANTNTSLHTFYALNQESWTLSSDVINTYYVNIPGYVTPTSLHEGSYDSQTTRSAGYSWNLTSNVSFYGVYSLITYTFRICESTVINGNSYNPIQGKNVTYTVEESSTITITGVHLNQGHLWYIDDNGESSGGAAYIGHTVFEDMTLSNDKIGISVTNISTPLGNRSVYFGVQDSNIRTLIGGTYSITINIDASNWTNTKITEITLTDIDTTDFKILGKGGAFNDRNFNIADAFTATGVTANGTTFDYSFGSKHLFIQDQFKAGKVYQSGTDGHLLENTFTGCTSFFYLNTQDENNILSRLDANVTIIVKFTVSDGTFSIDLSSYAETAHTSIDFNHARDAGIYIEITNTLTDGIPDWSNVEPIMMHTTSNPSYEAQEAPITLSSGQYIRIFRTHSNITTPNADLITEADIRAATETYYYTLANTPTGFTQRGSYIETTAQVTLHRWTISLTNDNNHYVHIIEYTGSATQSVEHHVPYYLVGRGMPGSDIRGCDYTIAKGIQLYTWGNNIYNMGCYVGAYGTNASPGQQIKGNGISLVAGDVFRFSTAGSLINFAQTPHDDEYYTLTADGEVTINTSGTYLVYLTGTEGNEVINIEYDSSTTSWSRSSNIVARSAAGASLISVDGNVFSFGGNLDYSLLDAYGSDGYSFVIHLYHTSSSGGTITYKITNNNTYQIIVDKYDGSYAADRSYTTPQTINASATNSSLTRTINQTVDTCLRVTIPASAVKTMISSGSFAFSMNIEYGFVETTLS